MNTPDTSYAAFPFAIFLIAFWALRAAAAQSKGGVARAEPTSAADGMGCVVWGVRAVVQLTIVIIAWNALFDDKPFPSETRLIAVLVFCWPFVRAGSIRLGLVRTTYALAWITRPYGTWSDPPVSTLAYASRAVRHARDPEHSAAWLESKLRRVRWRTPRGLLTLAELAAARGDDARRRLLVATFDGLERPLGWRLDVSRAFAKQSLARQARRAHMADLIEAGRWYDAIPLGERSRDSFAWTLSNALRQLAGGKAPPWQLRLGAVFAPRSTWAYVRSALRSVPIEPAHDPFSLTALSEARPFAVTPAALAHAWDVWFADPATSRALESRSVALGCRGGGGLSMIREQALASVVALVERHGGTNDGDGLHRTAVDLVWEQRQSAVMDASARFPELAFDDMERAWIEWIALKTLWREAALVASGLRRTWLYERCWMRVLNHTVHHAHNASGQLAFASDVYRFLLTEAERSTHHSAELLRNNVRAAGG